MAACRHNDRIRSQISSFLQQAVVELRNWRLIKMKSNETRGSWREHVVDRLKNRYGLAEEQAQEKADVLVHWIAQTSAAAEPGFPFGEALILFPVKRLSGLGAREKDIN
jgi:hypothetical protein